MALCFHYFNIQGYWRRHSENTHIEINTGISDYYQHNTQLRHTISAIIILISEQNKSIAWSKVPRHRATHCILYSCRKILTCHAQNRPSCSRTCQEQLPALSGLMVDSERTDISGTSLPSGCLCHETRVVLDEPLGYLHGIESGTFFDLVAYNPEGKSVGIA